MRVELVYSPGCHLYKTVRDTLEDVIAEERLPIPVEMVEDQAQKASPTIRIDGLIVNQTSANHSFDSLRELLCRKWQELTEHSLRKN